MTERYSRQQLFAPIGNSGQAKIRKKHALVIGAGALGSANAEALVRAGVGKLTIIDRDYVEWSNLQRQQLYSEQDAKEQLPKAVAAEKRLKRINTDVEVNGMIMDAGAGNLEPLVKDADVIMDGSDNFDIRFIVNDLAQKHRVPWVYGSCVGSFGATCTIIPEKTPCLQCILKAVPASGATCDTAGIISPTVQMVAAYQVAEALKLLAEDFSALRGTFLTFDVWKNQHYAINLQKVKDEHCPSCGKEAVYPYLTYDHQTKTDSLCGRNTVQIRPAKPVQYDFARLKQQLKMQGKVEYNSYLLSCQLEHHRLVIFQGGRVLIHGTSDIQEAKSIYYRLLG
ncbi:thiazole biosynthesis adenylyltransferase ThiF [Bacillus xiapuensis]|uniref:thiazole biosynthesis adenylyltransferase ThiF n=1 Tax=Bacillus xiapuensis TaxID=2014075 RepID=UPI000C240114|nr:thiazole biosynthesis adenylyltransferase ThiF [Bacillus xiapuensis]